MALIMKVWCRTDHHGLPELSRAPKVIAQDKNALIEIMGVRVGIAWNLAGWSKMVFWAIVVLTHEVPPKNGKFLHLGFENCGFAVYSNFCFLNNFLFKI